jgi:hypothetical protein
MLEDEPCPDEVEGWTLQDDCPQSCHQLGDIGFTRFLGCVVAKAAKEGAG